MTKDSIALINGHEYKYRYNPDSRVMDYLGPVGDGPRLTEDQFREAMEKKKSGYVIEGSRTWKLLKALQDKKDGMSAVDLRKMDILYTGIRGSQQQQDILEKGFVTKHKEKNRVFFKITSKGREALIEARIPKPPKPKKPKRVPTDTEVEAVTEVIKKIGVETKMIGGEPYSRQGDFIGDDTVAREQVEAHRRVGVRVDIIPSSSGGWEVWTSVKDSYWNFDSSVRKSARELMKEKQ
jgi:hypothetical protein